MYSQNKRLCYELYQRAKDFGHRPSELAFFGDSVGQLFHWFFDRGIWAWGRHVEGRLTEATHGGNPTFAASRREAAFQELMGGDVSSAFAAPDMAGPSRRALDEAEENGQWVPRDEYDWD